MTGDYSLNTINCAPGDWYNPNWYQPIWVIPPYTYPPICPVSQPQVTVTWTITQASIDASKVQKEIASLKKRIKKLEAKK